MKKKVFFELYRSQSYWGEKYWPVDDKLTTHFILENLVQAFEPVREFVRTPIDYFEKDHKVFIYLKESIKEMGEISFRSDLERKQFEKAYDIYYEKRWDDMPLIKISGADFEELKKKWEKVKEIEPEFLVFILDDYGLIHKVDITFQNILSEQDRNKIEQGHQKYLRWEKAYELYKQDHPFHFVSDYWYGADDSFFESDLEPYYDRETPLLEKKKYTKKQIGLELKEKVAQKEYSQFLGKWFYQTLCSNIVDTDDHFNNLLKILYPMERYPEDMPSYEKLDEIADLIVAGRDDEIKLDF